MKARPGHERICTLASGQDHTVLRAAALSQCEKPQTAATGSDLGVQRRAPSSEPSDRAVRRSARRLHLLGSRASASRLPGSARPRSAGPAGSEGPNTGWGARQRAHQLSEFAAELPCATRDSERDEQDGRPVDQQLGRTSSDVSLPNVFGGLCVLAIIFYLGFCW